MPKFIKIDNQLVGLGESKRIDIHVARLPSNTPIDIPVFINRAKIDGPTVLLLAGMHGDEVNGIEIIRRLIAESKLIPDAGSIIAIPILNVFGFLNYSRQVPDGKDVNRSFPGSKVGSLASRIAQAFTSKILPLIDYGIDFHTGGGSRYNYPQTRCLLELAEQVNMAKAFGAPLLLNSKLRDKSLRKYATLHGKNIIVYESGETLRLDEQSIAIGMQGALNVLRHLGILKSGNFSLNNSSIIIEKSSWSRATRSGIFRSVVSPGQEVCKNQLLGSITDPFGDLLIKVKAHMDGIVVGLNHSPVISQGDALLHLGTVLK